MQTFRATIVLSVVGLSLGPAPVSALNLVGGTHGGADLDAGAMGLCSWSAAVVDTSCPPGFSNGNPPNSTLESCKSQCENLAGCTGISHEDTPGYTACLLCTTAGTPQQDDYTLGITYFSCDSGASGDPHVTNILRESFDVMQTGLMALLVIPRGTDDESKKRKFLLQAQIERFGLVNCGPTFITKVVIDGLWLASPIAIRSGKEHTRKPFAIKFGQGEWMVPSEFVDQKNGHMRVKRGFHEKAFTMTVNGVQLRVEQPKRPRAFLNTHITGLGNLHDEIGGLLGVDQHDEAATPPKECDSEDVLNDNDYQSASIAFL